MPKTVVHRAVFVAGLVVCLCVISGRPAMAQALSAFGTTTLEGTPTGIVRDIETIGDQLFLGAENGLFQILGNTSYSYDNTNSPLGAGYIAGLTKDDQGNLWIAEFGGGMFKLASGSRQITKIDVPHPFAEYAWHSLVADNKLVLSFITGFLVYDLVQSRVTAVHTEVKGNKIDGLFRLEQLADNQIGFVQHDALISFDLDSLQFSITPRASQFPRLGRLTSLKRDEQVLFVGGDEGLYQFNPGDQTSQFYPFSAEALRHLDVASIFRDGSDKIWVAAGGLFTLDQASGLIVRSGWYLPVLNPAATMSVMALAETDNGELIFSSSQLGIVYLPTVTQSFNFVTNGDAFFHGNISAATAVNDTSAVLHSPRGLYQLHARQARVNLTDSKEQWQYQGREDCLIALYYQRGFRGETLNRLMALCEPRYPVVVDYIADTFLLYSSGRFLVISGEGEILDQFSAPQQLVHALYTRNNELYVADEKGRVFVQRSKFSWKQLVSNHPPKILPTCLVEGLDRIWICTTGQGLAYLFDDDDQLHFIHPSITGGSKYIRAAGRDGLGYLWVATNKGLQLLNEDTLFAVPLDRLDGIPDSDFNQGGVLKVGRSMLVVGDRYSYLFDIPALHQAVQRRASRISRVRIQVLGEPSGHQPIKSGLLSTPLSSWTQGSGDEALVINLGSGNHTQFPGQRLEYRLLGLEDDWVQSDSHSARIGYSSLQYGEYQFQARVVDPRSNASQPVSTLDVQVPPPFWLTLPAYVFYCVVSLLMSAAGYQRYRSTLARRGSHLKGMVNEKQKALEASHVSIRRLLQRKQRLFTNISHELRTPLSLIIGPLQQIQEEPRNPENRHRLDVVSRNARRLECLVNQLMQIEQFETLREQPRQSYIIEKALPLILAEVSPLAELKNQQLDCSVKGRGRISLHAESLEKIVTNLISNAVKYTSEGGLIRVSAECCQLHLVIKVSDTGIGMSKSEIKLIFNRFTRLDSSEDEPGSGVGLALVKELVVANGGWISVESELGKGSCFTVNLPMYSFAAQQSLPPVKQTDSQVQESAPQTELGRTLSTDKPTVLIVEDNDEMRRFLHDVLKTSYSCVTAKNGRHALEVAAAILPSVILTDYMMPEMDGIELAGEIRRRPLMAPTPIIMLTALGDAQTRHNSLRANVDYCVTKPVKPLELKLRIENLLKLRHNLASTANTARQPGNGVSLSEQPVPEFSSERDQAFYVKFVRLIDGHYQDEQFNRRAAAEALHMSERQLNRKLAELLEHNFVDYLKMYRLNQSRQLLKLGGQITQVALDVGFSSASYFSSCFKQQYGQSPKDYQEAATDKVS